MKLNFKFNGFKNNFEMLFFLFSTLIYTIWKENCITIHNKYKFDFTNLSNQSIIKYQYGSSNYFIKLCSEKTESTQSDFFVLQCSLKNDCQLIIAHNNVNIIPRNPQNFTEGLIFVANGESSSYKNGKAFNIKLDLKCDPNIIGINNIEMTFNESSTISDSMIIKLSSSAACPKIIPSPISISGSTSEFYIKHIQTPNTTPANKQKINLNADEEQTATIKNDESDEAKNTDKITIQIESETSKVATESEAVTNENSATLMISKSQSQIEETFSNTEDSATHITIETQSETENSATFMTTKSQIEETFSNTEKAETFITTESQSETKETFVNTEEVEIIATTAAPTSTIIITAEPTFSATSSAMTSDTKTPEITDDFSTSTAEQSNTNDNGNDFDSSPNKKKSKFHICMAILIIVGAVLFLYFVVGTAFVSIRDKSFHLPNRRFWRRCGKMCSKKEQEYTFKLISDSD